MPHDPNGAALLSPRKPTSPLVARNRRRSSVTAARLPHIPARAPAPVESRSPAPSALPALRNSAAHFRYPPLSLPIARHQAIRGTVRDKSSAPPQIPSALPSLVRVPTTARPVVRAPERARPAKPDAYREYLPRPLSFATPRPLSPVGPAHT